MSENIYESRISFEPIIQNYEESIRGIAYSYEEGKKDKMFPESAGSMFISKWISHLRTILIGINTLANLGDREARQRIISNSEAFVVDMITDPTVKESDMPRLAEGFHNILIDSYLGMRKGGHFSNLMREQKHDKEEETPESSML